MEDDDIISDSDQLNETAIQITSPLSNDDANNSETVGLGGTGKYGQQLRFLNILPLPMHIQILNLLTLSTFVPIFVPATPQL